MLSAYACGTLIGWQKPLLTGCWNGGQRRAASSMTEAVKRTLLHSQDAMRGADEVERDVKCSRVSYSGEEIETCHELTLEQVEPALPPLG